MTSTRRGCEWYRPRDLLPDGLETVIGADSILRETVDRIRLVTAWSASPRWTADHAGLPDTATG
ncbi:hypothetical protein [Streptomyces collinus]|uniref:hypothetical protein n=1 Tax=Streptomyces collinus TaxID=42684 RepID=UPI00381E0E72